MSIIDDALMGVVFIIYILGLVDLILTHHKKQHHINRENIKDNILRKMTILLGSLMTPLIFTYFYIKMAISKITRQEKAIKQIRTKIKALITITWLTTLLLSPLLLGALLKDIIKEQSTIKNGK